MYSLKINMYQLKNMVYILRDMKLLDILYLLKSTHLLKGMYLLKNILHFLQGMHQLKFLMDTYMYLLKNMYQL